MILCSLGGPIRHFILPCLSLSLSRLARSSFCASYYHCRGPGHLLSRPRLDFFWQFPAVMLHGLLCFCRERRFHRVEDFRLFSHDATFRRVALSENHHLFTAHESSLSACHSSVNPHQALSCVRACVCVCVCAVYIISHLPQSPIEISHIISSIPQKRFKVPSFTPPPPPPAAAAAASAVHDSHHHQAAAGVNPPDQKSHEFVNCNWDTRQFLRPRVNLQC